MVTEYKLYREFGIEFISTADYYNAIRRHGEILIKPGRRNGNTTRIADWVIQRLFEGYIVELYDLNYDNPRVEDHLVGVIKRRLILEHGIQDCIHEIRFNRHGKFLPSRLLQLKKTIDADN